MVIPRFFSSCEACDSPCVASVDDLEASGRFPTSWQELSGVAVPLEDLDVVTVGSELFHQVMCRISWFNDSFEVFWKGIGPTLCRMDSFDFSENLCGGKSE